MRKTIISTHAPRVGSDRASHWDPERLLTFQLTLPVWGATRRKADHAHRNADFNSRSPCGERHAPFENPLNVFKFQLTLPVWGATRLCRERLQGLLFHLTLPVWGATKQTNLYAPGYEISTHAPRVGSDRA